MFERGRNAKQVGKDFRLAFAETNGLEPKGLSKNVEYREYARHIREILNMAKCGRAWYEEHRAKGTGFYRMRDLAQAQSKPKPTPEPEVGDAPPWPPDIFIDVADEGQKFLNSKFFTKLATIVDSVEVEQGQTAECSEIVTILKRLIAVSSEALEKLS
jgi:hypothetical protein